MSDLVTKDDLMSVLNKFTRKTLAETFSRPTEYETSTFRQPELYGLPIFAIGYGGRPIAYLGQYIAHKIIKTRVNGRIETRWRILTGFVRIIAKHREDDIFIELFANGVPSAGVVEWVNSRDQFALLEDRKELNEIECREEDIVNLSGVMKYEDPVILIDVTGLLRELPADIFARYTEILAVYRSLQTQVFEMEDIMDDLRVELETTKAENRVLRSQIHRLSTRIIATAGVLMHYKSELLRIKELMQFNLERLEAVKEGKENIQAVLNDLYDLMETYRSVAGEIVEKISQIEKLGEEVERVAEARRKIEEQKPVEKKEEKKEKEEEKGEKE